MAVRAILRLAGEGLCRRRVDGGRQEGNRHSRCEHRDLRDGHSFQAINSQGVLQRIRLRVRKQAARISRSAPADHNSLSGLGDLDIPEKVQMWHTFIK